MSAIAIDIPNIIWPFRLSEWGGVGAFKLSNLFLSDMRVSYPNLIYFKRTVYLVFGRP